MKSIAVLIEATCWDPVANASKTLRVTNRNDPRVTTWNNLAWRPNLRKSPILGLSVFNGNFSGYGEVTIDNFEFTPTETDLDEAARYVWHGAVVKIYAGDTSTTPFAPTLIFTAVGAGAVRTGAESISVTLTTRDELLNKPMLYLGYAGTGDIEGTADLTGVLKPMVFGDAKYIAPVLIDEVRQIYQVHGYGPVESIYGVFEGGLPIGTGGNPAATQTGTYATFRDTAVAQGQWIRHNNLGLIKLGSQPTFPITAHVKGDSNGINGGACLKLVGDLVKRAVTMNVANVTVKAASITAINTAAPYELDLYLTDQISVGEVLQQLLLSIGGYWCWDEIGDIILGRMRFGASEFTLSKLNDRLPDVIGVNQLPTSAPVWSLRFGAAKCHYVHDGSSVPQALIDLQAEIDAIDPGATVHPPSSTPPALPVTGDVWPDTSTGVTIMRRYSGSAWIAIMNMGSDTRLVAMGSVVAADIIANSFKRAAGSGDYNYAVRTSNRYLDSAFVRMPMQGSGFCIIGLDDDTTTTAQASQKWQLVVHVDGTWNLYKDGVSQGAGDVGTAPVGTNIELHYKAGKVRAYVGTTQVGGDQTAPVNQAYYGKFWAYQAGSFAELEAGFLGGATWGSDIANIPANLAALVGTEGIENQEVFDIIANDDVVSTTEKKTSLAKLIADLENRYRDLYFRAVAMGLSTTTLTTARSEWITMYTTYMDALDTDVDTVIYTPWMPSSDNLPTGWFSDNVNTVLNGDYYDVQDASTTVYGSLVRSASVTGSGTNRAFGIRVKKDAVGKATRYPAFRFYSSGAVVRYQDLFLDTSTGEFALDTAVNGGVLAANVWDLGTEWFVAGAIQTNNAGAQDVGFQIFPAIGASATLGSGRAVTVQGTIGVRDARAAVGTRPSLGRPALDGYLAAYVSAMVLLAKAISERDGTTGLVINPPAAQTIAATSAGVPKDLPGFVLQLTASVGTAAVTTLGTWSLVGGWPTGVNGSLGAATGTLTLSQFDVGSAELNVQFVYQNVTRTAKVSITRIDDPPSTGGGSGGGSAGTSASTTAVADTVANLSYATPTGSDILQVAVDSTPNIVLTTGNMSYKRKSPGNFDGSTRARGKWQWRVVGGSFADLTGISETIGSYSVSTVDGGSGGEPVFTVTTNGSINCTVTANTTTCPGMTTGTYEFRFIWCDDSTANARRLTKQVGTLSATSS